jgi:hypothetical protein
MDLMIKDIVDSLFCTLVTLSTIPIIRAPRGFESCGLCGDARVLTFLGLLHCFSRNAAELVARRLEQRIREQIINSRSTLFPEASLQRPVLVILDRSIDFGILLHHSWTYQAMIHDLFDMKAWSLVSR